MPGSKRAAAQLRLKAGFLATLSDEVRSLSALLAEDGSEETRETVAFDMSRLAQTARSLGLQGLSDGAKSCAERIAAGTREGVFRGMVHQVRQLGAEGLFLPVAIVGNEKTLASARQQDDGSCEPVRGFTTVEQLLGSMTVEWVSAVAMPASMVQQMHTVTGELDCPVYLYGAARAWKQRTLGTRMGAAGYLSEPLSLAELLAQVRYRASRPAAVAPVFVYGPDEATGSIAARLEAAGQTVATSAVADDIGRAMHEIYPSAVVLASDDDAAQVQVLQTLRGHVGRGHVPLIALASGDGAAQWDAGADDVLPAATVADLIVRRVRARIERFSDHRRERDGLTRAPNRSGVLDALQRMVARARRSGETLSVVLVQVDGIEHARANSGPEAANACLRHLAAAMERGLRRVDLVGFIGQDTFLAGLPSCRAGEAQRRMQQISAIFVKRCHADRRLREVSVVVGVTDSQPGLRGLALRAQTSLFAAKAARP